MAAEGLTLSFAINGDVQYARGFQAYAHEVADLSEPLERIGDDLQKHVGQQFGTEGGHSGEPWAQLSPKYAAWKEEHFPGMPILVATGDMRAAALSPEAIFVTGDSLTYSVEAPAGWHQDGTENMPARPLVRLPSRVRRGWDRIVVEWLNEQRRGRIGR